MQLLSLSLLRCSEMATELILWVAIWATVLVPNCTRSEITRSKCKLSSIWTRYLECRWNPTWVCRQKHEKWPETNRVGVEDAVFMHLIFTFLSSAAAASASQRTKFFRFDLKCYLTSLLPRLHLSWIDSKALWKPFRLICSNQLLATMKCYSGMPE